jgi:hypothetical protein
MLLPESAVGLAALTAVVLSHGGALITFPRFERRTETRDGGFAVRQGYTAKNNLATGDRAGRAVRSIATSLQSGMVTQREVRHGALSMKPRRVAYLTVLST